MRIFGLVPLLIVIAVIGWWLSVGLMSGPAPTAPAKDRSSQFYVIPADSESVSGPSYGEAIDAARSTADALGQ